LKYSISTEILSINKFIFICIQQNRPDIAYAVGRLSMFTSNPKKEYWAALERVFKYLRETIDYYFTCIGYPDATKGNSDANWVTVSNSVKSTTRFIFIFGGATVSWKSYK